MRVSDFVAQTITQRRALVWSGVALLTIGCIAILVTSLRLDSEVFNVLPGRFSSVQGLKIYDRDFEQTRELTFGLHHLAHGIWHGLALLAFVIRKIGTDDRI